MDNTNHDTEMVSENSYAAMVQRLAKPGEEILVSMTFEHMHALHMAVGISGEAGELLAACANGALFGNELDIENVVEELGDLEFYMEGLRQGYGFTREECVSVRTDAKRTEGSINSVLISIAAGDLLDLVKKATVHAKEVDRFKVLHALGIMEVHMGDLRSALKLTREQCLEANTTKLLTGKNARYASGQYSDEQAHARADKAGDEAA